MPDGAGRYHVVRFDDDLVANEVTLRLFEVAEAVAASSVRGTDRIVVWTSSPWAKERELFLSDGALTAAQQAGLALRVDREVDHAGLPVLKALLIGDAPEVRP
jgi:hypothetical protein